jgi:aspartate 1-decarboxylase
MPTHRMMNSKIHRARITGADLHYVGSIAIDPSLLSAAKIIPNEQVEIWNINTGARFDTYAIAGTPGQICLNGAAARLAQPGDLVIIVTFVDVARADLAEHQSTVVVVDEANRPVEISSAANLQLLMSADSMNSDLR